MWQWVVDLDPGLPAPTDVLVNCHDFLIDDDCGREVGVVEGVDIDPNSAVSARLLVVQGLKRHRTTVAVDDVIEVVIRANGGWLSRATQDTARRRSSLQVKDRVIRLDTSGTVRWLVARLTGRRTEPPQRR